ncbi:DUF2855 family protein [Actinokineospora sp. 24-640]
MDSWEVLVKKDDLAVSEIVAEPGAALGDGQVRLATERFALTQINVTYARLGDSLLPFWNVFPGPEGYGRVPVWAFARVVESRHPEVAEGSRFFGYLPMATGHVVDVDPVARGFVDPAPERAFLHPWYRTYQRVGETDVLDDFRAVLRPLFPASYNLAAFLAEHARAGVKSVLVSSASSKTALGMADLLHRESGLTTVGLTSPGNVDFVRSRGVYGSVATYAEIGSLSLPGPTVFVDFTGQVATLAAVHERFGGQLAHTALVGYTHPDAVVVPPELPGPTPKIFFTPAVEGATIAAEGEDAYFARYHEAEQRFIESVPGWCALERLSGPESVARVFAALAAGEQDPGACHVFTP